MTVLKRYHIDIFVPAWGREASLEFSKGIAGKPMGYSKHAIKKSKLLSRKLRKAVKLILEKFSDGDNILLDFAFEFYADDNNKIKKMCYRFPLIELGTDIIVVMSSKGTVVTIYINKNFDKHRTLNKGLYEKEIV